MNIPNKQKSSSPVTYPILNQLMDRAGISNEEKQFTMKWEELDDLYNVVGSGLIDQAISINSAIAAFKLHAVPMTNELAVTVNGITKDIVTMTDELVAIRKHHEGKKGFVQDEDISIFLTTGQDYKTAADRIQSLLVTPMLTVSEHLIEVQQAMLKKDAEDKLEKDLVDPNVISDAVVKEPVAIKEGEVLNEQ